jgi:hypothetical protein
MTFIEQVAQAVENVHKNRKAKLPYGSLIRMMEEKGQDVLRVYINDDGTFDIIDFTLPSLGKKQERNIPQEDVPKWILSTVSVLRVATEGDLVEGIGFKVSDRLYFIADRRGV